MLQQTRVETVIPYYERFIEAFPTVTALADAPLDAVLQRWSGLGYYRRARMLHGAAQEVRDRFGGALPATAAELRSLTGVGAYTAGAVASIAYGEAAPLVDGNVARVFARIFALEEDVRAGAGLAKVWALAGDLVPATDAGDYNQALMELGATVCVPREPRCLLCPVAELCEARARGLEGTLPILRPKAEPRVLPRTALVARQGERVWIAQRGEVGTFAGMWEPPSVAPGERPDELTALTAVLGLRPADLEAVEERGSVVHVLSHRRLEVTVLAARTRTASAVTAPGGGDYVQARAVEPSALGEYALTTYARKVLAKVSRF